MDELNDELDLDKIIAEATAAITDDNFHLQVHGGTEITRERAYCYELYHQMRSIWPDNCQYVLTAELDKSGHPAFREHGINKIIPDLVVHVPGKMDNFAAIEVKSQKAKNAGVKKDITNLRIFRDKMKYERVIQLVFGSPLPKAFRDFPDDIELWHHADVGSPAKRIPPTPHEDHPNSPT